MIKQCEMHVLEYFYLSTGQVAFIGNIVPDIDRLITATKADLLIGDVKIKTINITGEDRFSRSGTDRQNKRALRTDDDVISELRLSSNKDIKLNIYII